MDDGRRRSALDVYAEPLARIEGADRPTADCLWPSEENRPDNRIHAYPRTYVGTASRTRRSRARVIGRLCHMLLVLLGRAVPLKLKDPSYTELTVS